MKENETKKWIQRSDRFVFAAAGSAVGVGNLWRFPYLAAKMEGSLSDYLSCIGSDLWFYFTDYRYCNRAKNRKKCDLRL